MGISIPSIIASDEPTSTQIAIYFSEPLTASIATTLSNYSVSGKTISGIALKRDNTEVLVTLSTAMTVGTAYTVTMNNLTTVSGNQVPAKQSLPFNYAAYVAPNWTATLYRANVTVGSVAQAQTVISTPSEQTSVTTATESVLNFLDTGPAGHFANPSPFPGMTIGEGLSNYVLQAKGTIVVSSSQAGYYTFGVSSDDGYTMTITGTASPTA